MNPPVQLSSFRPSSTLLRSRSCSVLFTITSCHPIHSAPCKLAHGRLRYCASSSAARLHREASAAPAAVTLPCTSHHDLGRSIHSGNGSDLSTDHLADQHGRHGRCVTSPTALTTVFTTSAMTTDPIVKVSSLKANARYYYAQRSAAHGWGVHNSPSARHCATCALADAG